MPESAIAGRCWRFSSLQRRGRDLMSARYTKSAVWKQRSLGQSFFHRSDSSWSSFLLSTQRRSVVIVFHPPFPALNR
jgi:hypothetical protein